MIQDLQQVVVKRLIHQQFADAALSVFHQAHDFVDALNGVLQRVHHAKSLLHQILNFAGVDARKFLAGPTVVVLLPDLILMYLVPSTLAELMEASESLGISLSVMLRYLHVDANQPHWVLGTGEREWT